MCSNQNGMCSKFCLPRGENDRVCDCEDGNIVNSEGLCPGGMYIGDINTSYYMYFALLKNNSYCSYINTRS